MSMTVSDLTCFSGTESVNVVKWLVIPRMCSNPVADLGSVPMRSIAMNDNGFVAGTVVSIEMC